MCACMCKCGHVCSLDYLAEAIKGFCWSDDDFCLRRIDLKSEAISALQVAKCANKTRVQSAQRIDAAALFVVFSHARARSK